MFRDPIGHAVGEMARGYTFEDGQPGAPGQKLKRGSPVFKGRPKPQQILPRMCDEIARIERDHARKSKSKRRRKRGAKVLVYFPDDQSL